MLQRLRQVASPECKGLISQVEEPRAGTVRGLAVVVQFVQLVEGVLLAFRVVPLL